VIKIKRSIRYVAKFHVVGKSGEDGGQLLAPYFLPPFVNIFSKFLLKTLAFS
jgi:hypothetical protein